MNGKNSSPATPEKKDSTASDETSGSSLFILKLYFFFFHGAIGSSIPYLALYFKQLGLNTGYAGTILGLRNLTEFFGAPVWGTIGDRFKIRKAILFVSIASFAAGTLFFLAVQPHNQQCIEISPNGTKIAPLIFTSGGVILGKASQEKFESNESSTFHINNSTTFIRKNDAVELNDIFLIFLMIMLLGQIVGSTDYAMIDGIVVAFLAEKVSQFGNFRLWGEVGDAVGSFSVGGVVSLYQSNICGLVVKNYFISFYFFAGLMGLAMCTCVFIKVTYREQPAAETVSYSSLTKELLRVRNLVVLFVAYVFGVFHGFHENFGLWYLDDLGAEAFTIGLASGLRFTAAIVGYFSSRPLISSFDIERPIAVCLLLYSAVLMGLAFVQQIWLGVILYSAQGALYGLGWSCCVVFGGKISLKAGSFAAIQGIMGGFHWGLGYGVGTVIAGFLVKMIGIPNMYLCLSLMSIVALLVFLLTYCIKRQTTENNHEEGYNLVPTNEDSENKGQ